MISKQPKLQRQKRIFKQVMPRAKQMNINIVTWGRWMKQSSRIPNSRTIAVSQSNEMPPVRTRVGLVTTVHSFSTFSCRKSKKTNRRLRARPRTPRLSVWAVSVRWVWESQSCRKRRHLFLRRRLRLPRRGYA
jgi:hypothetical protein